MSDTTYGLWYVHQITHDETTHNLPECGHGPRVDNRVDAAVEKACPEYPHSSPIHLRNDGSHAIREEADEESENDDGKSLRHVNMVSE